MSDLVEDGWLFCSAQVFQVICVCSALRAEKKRVGFLESIFRAGANFYANVETRFRWSRRCSAQTRSLHREVHRGVSAGSDHSLDLTTTLELTEETLLLQVFSSPCVFEQQNRTKEEKLRAEKQKHFISRKPWKLKTNRCQKSTLFFFSPAAFIHWKWILT